jgi:Ca2+-binding EF-hand superfamily protein
LLNREMWFSAGKRFASGSANSEVPMPACLSSPDWEDSDGKTCKDYTEDPALCKKEENIVAHQICAACGSCGGGLSSPPVEIPPDVMAPPLPASGCPQWEHADTDKSGGVTTEEMEAFLAMSGLTEPDVKDCVMTAIFSENAPPVDEMVFCAAVESDPVFKCLAEHGGPPPEEGPPSEEGCGPWDMIDADQDGDATFEEVQMAIHEHMGADMAQAEGFVDCIFSMHDLNKDGKISKEEFCEEVDNGHVESCMQKHGLSPEHYPEHHPEPSCPFHELEGSPAPVPITEVMMFVHMHFPGAGEPGVLECLMEGWDADADGMVNEEEFCSHLYRMREIVPMCHGAAGHAQGGPMGMGPMEFFWSNLGLREEAVADGCDTDTPGACCAVLSEGGEIHMAVGVCMASLAPDGPHSLPEEPWTEACRSFQCTSSLQLLDDIAARDGALCTKLEPVLHAVSALGASVCAPDAVNDELPCISNAVSVVMKFMDDAQKKAFEEREPEPKPEPFEPVPTPPAFMDDEMKNALEEEAKGKEEHALFASEERSILRAFHDFLGLRRGPAEVVRALMARIPASRGVPSAASKLRKVVHHAHRHQVVHHTHQRRGLLNVHRSKGLLLNQAPIALAQFGVQRLDLTQTLDSFCTPCVDGILAAAASLVTAIAPFLADVNYRNMPPMGPMERADPRDFVLMGKYLPTACIRASSNEEVCMAEPLEIVIEAGRKPAPDSLTKYAEPKAVCGECGLTRARGSVGLAMAGFPGAMNEAGMPSHPLFAVAAASSEPYAASWELEHACIANGDGKEDICYIPAMAFLASVMGDGTDGPDVAMTRKFTASVNEKHIPACLHSLGKEQDWLKGIHDEFVKPPAEPVCVPECKAWLTSLEADHGCCAPHLAAQHFTYACPPAFKGSCMTLTAEDADAVVAHLSELCEFAPPACPACGDALVFVVPAPLGEKTDLSEKNTEVLADALRADLASQTGEHIHVTIKELALVKAEEAFFLEAKIELGSAPCWRSQFVGDKLNKQKDAGELSFPALSAALANVKDPVVAPPLSAKHTVHMSLKLAGSADAFDKGLADGLAAVTAKAAGVPTEAVTVDIQQAVAESLLQGGRAEDEIVADVSIAGVAANEAPAMTMALVVAVKSGVVKNHLAEQGIEVTDSLVVSQPVCTEETMKDAKAALETALEAEEKALAEAKAAEADSTDKDAAAKKIETLEAKVADLKEQVASAPEKCDPAVTANALPSLATTPAPKTPPTAKPPAPGTKVVKEVDVPAADAEEPVEEGVLGFRITTGFVIAVSFLGIATCFFLASFRLSH